ncbi:phage tail tape measure protein [Erwinia sp. V90_4]|uniref:phage tail tape measure protein n=1 Tax=Erwinia sp. V90_4 TaxID=3044239 RepID=UPI00249DFB7A|nr:phage tail tape measure protein [Erwinia sp. V90_4]MDI3442298.1 phage tail tape measure protein [Erwinia sp. V90_4]
MMSIKLGLDGLRKAVIRASLFLNDLPGETHSLGNAMFQQRVALTASATRTRNATRNSKSALKASKERLQEIRITEALERPQRARDNLNKAQQRFTLGQSKVQQRYQAGQGVVDKIGAVSGQAMSVARQGAKLLQPGYQALTAQPAAATPGAEPSPAAGLPPTRAAASADNLAGDIARLNGAIEAISIAIFQQLDGTLRSLTQTATGLLGSVDRWIQANPALAGGMAQLVAGGVILVGALGAIGSVVAPVLSGLNLLIAGAGMLSSVFTFAGGAMTAALGAITLPIAGIALAVAAGVALIYQYWEPISAFFAGVMRGIGSALAPAAQFFAPFKPVFDRVGAGIAWLYDAFKQLMQPIALTGEALNKIGGAGEWIGKALGDAFMLPLKIFNDLSSGIIGLMEKLGLIDKKSADAQASLRDQPPEQPPLSALGGAGESFPQSEFPVALGGARYKPVTATTSSSSQQNTFNSSYVINVPAGMGEADVRTLIENHEQQTRARAAISQRSSYLG